MRISFLAFAFALASCSNHSRRGQVVPDGGMPVQMGGCQGLACNQVSCGAQPPTSVSGRVTAPNGIDPVPNALVYVPTNVPEFTPGVQCEACNDPIGGQPIVSTVTDTDGKFLLANVPAATQVPVIVQKGRFRRQLSLSITACQDHPLAADQTRLPRKQSEGDLPRIAVGIGDYDQIECVLRSIGIDESEFTSPQSTGMVHLYDNSNGMPASGTTTLEQLLDDPKRLNGYNLVFINCTGQTFDLYGTQTLVTQNLYNYVNAGGRLYVTDWSYDYMEQVPQFAPYVFFDGGGDTIHPQPMKGADWIWNGNPISATIADPQMAAWMNAVKASPDGTVSIQGAWALAIETAADQSTYTSTTWVHGSAIGRDRPLTVTYNYNGCGKVLWSSYHTQEPGGGPTGGANAFPTYCKSTPQTMLPQEKILEYLIFEISGCVIPLP
jgi:hypothetical protein